MKALISQQKIACNAPNKKAVLAFTDVFKKPQF